MGGGERRLGVLHRGSLIGEMSLFSEDGSHTAGVRALTPLRLLEMTRPEFDALLHRQPMMAYDLVRLLSRRLERSENLTILDLQEKNRQLTQAYLELEAAQAQVVEKKKLEHELELAGDIQLQILPEVIPRLPGLTLERSWFRLESSAATSTTSFPWMTNAWASSSATSLTRACRPLCT